VKHKLLVFTTTKGFKHQSIPVGQLTLQLLGEKTGLFETVASNDLENFEPDTIAQFDAICFLNTTGELFSPHTKKKKVKLSKEEEKEWAEKETRLKESLMSFIKSGKGFIGIHSATDSFYEWPEYGEMIGAYFYGHPWRHSESVDIMVPEEAADSPLVAYLNQEHLIFKEEIYEFKESQITGGAEVLLKLDPHKNSFEKAKRPEEKYSPISWVKKHAEGRVFYSSLGHNNEIYHNEKVLQHYLNGILWAFGELN